MHVKIFLEDKIDTPVGSSNNSLNFFEIMASIDCKLSKSLIFFADTVFSFLETVIDIYNKFS